MVTSSQSLCVGDDCTVKEGRVCHSGKVAAVGKMICCETCYSHAPDSICTLFGFTNIDPVVGNGGRRYQTEGGFTGSKPVQN